MNVNMREKLATRTQPFQALEEVLLQEQVQEVSDSHQPPLVAVMKQKEHNNHKDVNHSFLL